MAEVSSCERECVYTPARIQTLTIWLFKEKCLPAPILDILVMSIFIEMLSFHSQSMRIWKKIVL